MHKTGTHSRPVASEPGGAGLLEAALDVVRDGLVGAVPAVNLLRLHFAPVRPLPYSVPARLVALKLNSSITFNPKVLFTC